MGPVPKLIAFDLDGTLTRGPTVCEAVSTRLGRYDEMRAFERARTREEIIRGRECMAEWYRPYDTAELTDPLREIPLAPGAREALAQCHAAGVATALLSLTWNFAVGWFAEQLGFDFYRGTVLAPDGIVHFWPEDKARWLERYGARHAIPREAIAAVGDSWGDAPMLTAAGRGVYLGMDPTQVPGVASYYSGKHFRVRGANVDDDYDVAVYLGFMSEKDYEDYLAHPTHIRLQGKWQPRLQWQRAYDTIDRTR